MVGTYGRAGRAGRGGQEPYPVTQRLKLSRAIDSLSEIWRGEVIDLAGARVRLRDAARSFRAFYCSRTNDDLWTIEGYIWRDRARVGVRAGERLETLSRLGSTTEKSRPTNFALGFSPLSIALPTVSRFRL